MKLVIGLGNPGREYDKTRHNIGFMVIDEIIKNKNLIVREKFNGIYTELNSNEEKIVLLKPQKYMNLSGQVVKQFVDFYKIDIEDIIVISDDLDLPLAKIKIKPAGSCGGHNGLRDIEFHLKSKNYKRVKVGIAKDNKVETKNYVLGKFNNEEQKQIDEAIHKCTMIVEDFPKLSFENLMNRYN